MYITWLLISLCCLCGSAIKVALLAQEEECIGLKATIGTEVIISYEVFPSEDSRVKVTVDKKQIDARTGKVLKAWENARNIPAWNHGRLNLTSDVFKEEQTGFRICFLNSGKARVSDLAFAIRADQYEELHDVATLDHTVGLFKAVNLLNKEAHKLSEQQHFALIREDSQRKAIRRVHFNMFCWSFVQAAFLTLLAVAQIVYLSGQFQGSKTLL